MLIPGDELHIKNNMIIDYFKHLLMISKIYRNNQYPKQTSHLLPLWKFMVDLLPACTYTLIHGGLQIKLVTGKFQDFFPGLFLKI